MAANRHAALFNACRGADVVLAAQLIESEDNNNNNNNTNSNTDAHSSRRFPRGRRGGGGGAENSSSGGEDGGDRPRLSERKRRQLAPLLEYDDEDSDEGWTCVSEACRVGGLRGALLVLLLDYAGADMNVQDLSGWSGLHWACTNSKSLDAEQDLTDEELKVFNTHAAFRPFVHSFLLSSPSYLAVFRALYVSSFGRWRDPNNNGLSPLESLHLDLYSGESSLEIGVFLSEATGESFRMRLAAELRDPLGADLVVGLIEHNYDAPHFFPSILPRELDQTPALYAAVAMNHLVLVRALLRAGANPAGHVMWTRLLATDEESGTHSLFPPHLEESFPGTPGYLGQGLEGMEGVDLDDRYQTPAHVAAAKLDENGSQILKWLFAAQNKLLEDDDGRYGGADSGEGQVATSIFLLKDSQGRTPLDVAQAKQADSPIATLIMELMERDPLCSGNSLVKAAAKRD